MIIPPPPPVSKNHFAQEPTPGSAVKFSHHFFYQGSGFFMFLLDVGQLFRCAGHHFMCVTTGPPIRGDPISHSHAHIPLKLLPPCSRPLARSNQPLTRNKQIFFPRYGVAHGCAQEPTPGSAVKFRGESVRKNRPLVPRSNIAGSWTRGGRVCHLFYFTSIVACLYVPVTTLRHHLLHVLVLCNCCSIM